ncbi:MAG: flagellar biosynthesis protein FlhF [Planctomycetota bacterium]|jgi:flagellar biosynthesis protein FlhF
MLIKRFTAPSLNEALQKVQTECGEHALVIETRHTRAGCLVVAAKPPQKGSREVAKAAPLHRWTKGFAPLARQARRFGMSRRVVTAVEDALIGTRVSLDQPGDPALPGVATKVLRALIQTEPLKLPAWRITTLVGPTGVGKTTTLAKLAARAHRDQGDRIAIISLDTYRVAAVEQLRAFADMLEVPFEVAFTPLDLRRALERHAGADRIFIDTTGRSPFDTDSLALMAGTIQVARGKSVLCMPAGLRRLDAEAVLTGYRRLSTASVILTKWDETEVPGEALSLLIEQGMSIAYVTVGQEVPEDIVTADTTVLAASAFCIEDHIVQEVL